MDLFALFADCLQLVVNFPQEEEEKKEGWFGFVGGGSEIGGCRDVLTIVWGAVTHAGQQWQQNVRWKTWEDMCHFDSRAEASGASSVSSVLVWIVLCLPPQSEGKHLYAEPDGQSCRGRRAWLTENTDFIVKVREWDTGWFYAHIQFAHNTWVETQRKNLEVLQRSFLRLAEGEKIGAFFFYWYTKVQWNQT